MVNKKTLLLQGAPDFGCVRIFVYGTLKKRGPNNIVLTSSGGALLGYDQIEIPGAAFMDLDAFPAMIYPITGSNQTTQIIRGEIWYGPPTILQSCDILEGHPLFFHRYKHWSVIHKRRVWAYSLPENWISEGQDFLSDTIWDPDDIELKFWKKYDSIEGANV